MNRIGNCNVFFKIILIIILSNSVVGVVTGHPNENGQVCTNCHNFENNNKSITGTIPVENNPQNKLYGSAIIQSTVTIQGGGPDCVYCHNISGTGAPLDKRIDVYAFKQGVHRNLSNSTINTTILSDVIDKACWACHGNGTEPALHPDSYKTPYTCADCHNATYNLNHTDSSAIYNLTTRKVYEHIPPPYYHEINSIVNNSNATCIGCHNKSMANYVTGSSINSNVSHYTSLTNLISPTINCGICHKSTINASTYWANVVRHPAKSQNDSFCTNCHDTIRALDLHSQQLVKPADIHFGFDWNNNDYINGPNANEACFACHSPMVTAFKKCEDCHLENGSGPDNSSRQIRSDYNDTVPRVYAHTNFSTKINVPNQSSIYPSSIRPSTCWSGNSSGSTCHGNPFGSKDQNGGYYATIGASYVTGAPYHSTATIDRLPNTVNCTFCHKQNDPTIRKAWGNATQITGGKHNWYMGDDNSRCWKCHVSTGVAPNDFHSDTMRGAGGDDCISCHVPNDVNTTKFGRHADINTTDGPGIVSNSDCWTCHYQKDMNRSHVYLCDSCHKNSSGIVPVTNPVLIISSLQHGSNTCKNCHAPDTYHVNGTTGPRGRIENPEWQLIGSLAGCHDCHTTHNGLNVPFHGPGIAVESGSYHILENKNATDPGRCGTSCHNSPLANATTHTVSAKSQSQKPVVINISVVPSTVIVSNTVSITANGSKTNKFLSIEAAQYQVLDNLDRIIIDWTSMNAKDGRFNSSYETVNATLDTTGLSEGTYKVSVRVMASAPKTILSKPYYPLNGDFSTPMNTTLVIEQPKGFLNGTVSNISSGLPIEGAIVTTNTTVRAMADVSGFYSLRLSNGTYLLNVTKDPEYNYNNTILSATIIADTTVIRDVFLTPKPVYTLSGKVTNASSGLGINGALVRLDAYSQYNTTTNNTGNYSINVPTGTYQVSASSSGYVTNVTTIAIGADRIQDFILTPSSGIFIPWIAYSQTDWYTPIQVQNIDSMSTNVSVSMYDQNGNIVATQTGTIQPSTASVFWPPVGPTAGGSAVITSTRNVIAIVNEMPKNGLDGMSYSGFSHGSTKIYIPWIAYSQTDWYTPIQVQNIDSMSTNVSVSMYDQNGNIVATQTGTIQPSTASVFWPPVGPTAGGSAVITSTRNVIAIVNEMGKVTSQAMSYEGFIAGSRKVYIPAINFSQTNTYTPIQVQNIGTVNTTVNVNLYDSNGTLIQTQSGIISPNTSSVFWPPIASTTYGSAVIESTQDVIAIVNEMINNNKWAMSYDGFAAGSGKVYIPWIAYGNSGWNTPVYVQNTGVISTNVALSFYDQNGAIVETRNVAIPANTSQIFVPAAVAPTTGGSAVVVSSQPVAVVVSEINAVSTNAMAYDGST